jgi:uncharacterized membrane protein
LANLFSPFHLLASKDLYIACIFVLWVSILPLSTIFVLDFETVAAVWYFGGVVSFVVLSVN